MDEIYKNIVFDIIADMLNKKKLDQIVTELFTRGRMLNIFIVALLLLLLFYCAKKY